MGISADHVVSVVKYIFAQTTNDFGWANMHYVIKLLKKYFFPFSMMLNVVPYSFTITCVPRTKAYDK